MRIRLSRWQQIGVIFSVLAFVGIGIYAWVFEARHRDSFYITQLIMCYNTLRTQNGALQGLGTQQDRAEREAANQAEYGQCMNEQMQLCAQPLMQTSNACRYFSQPYLD
jgi:hypothetical protein